VGRVPASAGLICSHVRDEDKNADDSIRVNRELDSNEIDESNLQHEKHEQPRISIFDGILTLDDVRKLRINL
jgi:hypothetical protein